MTYIERTGPIEWEAYVQAYKDAGYVDISECPECGSALARKPEWRRVVCMNYGACELSVG